MVVQWLRIRLSMQETWVRSLIWEDSTCHVATKPVLNYRSPSALEPVLRKKRSHCSERSKHSNSATREQPPLATTREKPTQQQRARTDKNK